MRDRSLAHRVEQGAGAGHLASLFRDTAGRLMSGQWPERLMQQEPLRPEHRGEWQLALRHFAAKGTMVRHWERHLPELGLASAVAGEGVVSSGWLGASTKRGAVLAASVEG